MACESGLNQVVKNEMRLISSSRVSQMSQSNQLGPANSGPLIGIKKRKKKKNIVDVFGDRTMREEEGSVGRVKLKMPIEERVHGKERKGRRRIKHNRSGLIGTPTDRIGIDRILAVGNARGHA